MLIEIEKLRVSRGGDPILHDVRLALGEGEIYGLLGPNGDGKSTTIAVALGLLKPESGRVRVFGRDPRIAAHEIYGALGVLPEQNGIYDWMSAEEYLGFFAALHRRHPTRKEMHRQVSAVGPDPRPNQAIGTYSRGMRQRLGRAFDSVNPFSAAVHAYDAAIIDSQTVIAQWPHAVVAVVWLALTLWLARSGFRRVAR